jgi:hypothetical protein
MLEVSKRAGVEVIQGDDTMTLIQQVIAEMGADEAGRPRHN